MNRETFSRGLAVLRGAYPQSRADLTSDSTIDVWFAVLGDLDGDMFLTGIKKIVQTQKFMPSIAEIREQVLGTTTNNLEAQALQAWAKVQYAIRKAGSYRSVVFDDPVIHHAISIQGGWRHLCSEITDDEMKFYRPQWLKAYQAFAKKQTEGALPAPPPLTGIIEIENQILAPEHIPEPMMITAAKIDAENRALNKPKTPALPDGEGVNREKSKNNMALVMRVASGELSAGEANKLFTKEVF